MPNEFRINVYQIDNRVMDRDSPINLGFPTAGMFIGDCSTSPTRSLPSGYNVYSYIQVPNAGSVNVQGVKYYVAETIAQLLVLLG